MEAKNIIKSLIAFQAACSSVDFDASVNYNKTKFKYATLGNIIKTIKPHLTKNKLAFSQVVEDGCMKTILFHESGETIESCYPLPNVSKAQELGSWMTYIKRYELASILGLVAEEDSDGNPGVAPQPVASRKSDDYSDEAIKSHLDDLKTKTELNAYFVDCGKHRKVEDFKGLFTARRKVLGI